MADVKNVKTVALPVTRIGKTVSSVLMENTLLKEVIVMMTVMGLVTAGWARLM